MSASKAFQFADLVGADRNVVQRVVLKVCEKKRIEVTRRNIQLQIKVLRMAVFVRQGAMKKLNS